MRRPLIPLAQCALVAAIALATYWTWLHLTGDRPRTVAAVVACTLISMTAAWAVEHGVQRALRGRPRRAHARPHPDTRKVIR